MTKRVAVTPRALSRAGHPSLDRLTASGFEVVFPAPGRQPTPEEQMAVLPGCVGYLAGVEPIGRDLLLACPELRVISRNGVGVDSVDLDAARELGVAVETAPGANSEGVAELTIGLMLAGLRHIPFSDAALKRGEWLRQSGVEVKGRTLGVIGAGQVGRRVIRAGLALGMVVRAHEKDPAADFRPEGDFAWALLDDVLGQSDVLTLHCPAGNAPLIDDARLRQVRHGCYLINTARATLVDHDAVGRALDDGQLVGFATDVFATEPPGPSKLLARANVIATPHVGGLTQESVERAAAVAVDNLLRALQSV